MFPCSKLLVKIANPKIRFPSYLINSEAAKQRKREREKERGELCNRRKSNRVRSIKRQLRTVWQRARENSKCPGVVTGTFKWVAIEGGGVFRGRWPWRGTKIYVSPGAAKLCGRNGWPESWMVLQSRSSSKNLPFVAPFVPSIPFFLSPSSSLAATLTLKLSTIKA